MGRRTVVGIVTAILLASAWLPAAAETAEIGTGVEAWFQGSLLAEDEPFCILPCPPVAIPEGTQPEDTLHVGVSGGRETARTYFTLDLTELPLGLTVTGGSVRLPVAGPDAGTVASEIADLIACSVTGFVQPAEGGPPADAPPTDCSVSLPLVLSDDGTSFVFDLAPMAGEEPVYGLAFAILPSEDAREQGGTWRVAFHGRDRDTADAEPITARIDYVIPEGEGSADPAPDGGSSSTISPDRDPTPPMSFDDFVADGPSGDVPSTPPEVEPPAVAGPSVPATEGADDEPVPVGAGAAPPGYDYPHVWLLPLAILVAGGLLTWSLSEDYEVDSDDLAFGT